MNRKNVLILGAYLILGAILIVVGLKIDMDYYSTLIFATGFGMAVNAAANLIREYHRTRPENKADYEQKRKEQRINLKDERKVFLRYKAAYRTMQFSMLVCFFGSGVLAWVRADVKIMTVLFALAVAKYVIASVIYKYFCAKM